jgi:FAD/FMN-containing dehydrogenase
MSSKVIWRDSPQYEEARIGRLFNHRYPDRYPRGIIEASCVQEVVDAIKLAKDMELRVSVRSGGHSWAAWSVRDEYVIHSFILQKHSNTNYKSGEQCHSH